MGNKSRYAGIAMCWRTTLPAIAVKYTPDPHPRVNIKPRKSGYSIEGGSRKRTLDLSLEELLQMRLEYWRDCKSIPDIARERCLKYGTARALLLYVLRGHEAIVQPKDIRRPE